MDWLNVSTPELAARSLFVIIAPFVLALLYLRLWPSKRKESRAPAAAAGAGSLAGEQGAPLLRILYGTQTGTARKFAQELEREVFALRISGVCFNTSTTSLAEYDQDNLEHEQLVVVIMSTWTGGAPPESARVFCAWLEDMVQDFRVSRKWLNELSYAVFGLGNADYDEHYCKAARQVDARFGALGGRRLRALGRGDDSQDQEQQFRDWKDAVCAKLVEDYARRGVDGDGGGGAGAGAGVGDVAAAPAARAGGSNPAGGSAPKKRLPLKEYRRQKRRAKEQAAARRRRAEAAQAEADADFEDELNARLVRLDSDSDAEDGGSGGAAAVQGCGGARPSGGGGAASAPVTDVEDLGAEMEAEALHSVERRAAPRAMVTPLQRRALLKEGYRILGTHSAVKLCRWTKHQLRGRGGCYKHTCYGITSYQCMETTPSLACANKCVFCWRHHKNPVGREWRWTTDPPQVILDGALEQHVNMVRQMKGVPGVIPQRLAEAQTVRHCALSLVGEPIMYPHINEFCRLLHSKRISSFLVTNAQFPDKIAAMDPVTQLYVSIDAGTKESLQAVDRPLFQDFWERFLGCLDAIRDKGQRTVYRLTLVKEWNMGEVDEYVSLIRRGQPDLIEIKAVTYCGKSDGSSLTIQNSPWHAEVRKFGEAIVAKLGGQDGGYGLAAEHVHSCCVLLAKTSFRVGGVWHTWIDYPRFHELIQKYYADGSNFTTADYMAPTPKWALYDAPEQGFDPVETRFRRTKTGKMVEIEYKASDSGCG
eukprot:g5942.t1